MNVNIHYAGENTGYITLDELYKYFDYLIANEGGQQAAEDTLCCLESYEGYAQHQNSTTSSEVDRNGPFWKRVQLLFEYMEKSIDERNDSGHITTDDLIAVSYSRFHFF